MAVFDRARALLREFKGAAYLFGRGVLPGVGAAVAPLGTKAALVRGTFPGSDGYVAELKDDLARAGVDVAVEIKGARPNAPREDVLRIAEALRRADPEVIVSFAGGSSIDATKAADVLRILGGDIESAFGTGQVTQSLQAAGRALTPHVAIQTLAGSAAHLTKYSNITDMATGQKKLVVDDAIVPVRPVFDYDVTFSAPRDLTADGAFDSFSHILEVLYGAVGRAHDAKAADIAAVGLPLVLEFLPQALADPTDGEAREALCLAADLGGYAIMVGGTNGAHLNSFSLVDILSHGRACAIMNPYYTVFFAPAIEAALRLVGRAYRQAGRTEARFDDLEGRALGLAVAEVMLGFARDVGFPTRLADVAGFDEVHIERALTAARNPQLRMKLQNMPVPLTAETVETYMRPILEAARDGNPGAIRNVL